MTTWWTSEREGRMLERWWDKEGRIDSGERRIDRESTYFFTPIMIDLNFSWIRNNIPLFILNFMFGGHLTSWKNRNEDIPIKFQFQTTLWHTQMGESHLTLTSINPAGIISDKLEKSALGHRLLVPSSGGKTTRNAWGNTWNSNVSKSLFPLYHNDP